MDVCLFELGPFATLITGVHVTKEPVADGRV